MTKNHETSLYVCEISDENIPTRKNVRDQIWMQIKQLAENESLPLSEEKQNVTYNRTKLSFSVMDSPKDNVFLLAFQPAGDVQYWGKNACNDASSDVLNFCGLLGEKIQISGQNELVFRRTQFSEYDRIDISEWDVVLPYAIPEQKMQLRDFLMKTRSSRYENILASSPKDIIFHIFSDSYSKDTDCFQRLKNLLRTYGKVVDPQPIYLAKEFSENIQNVRNKSISIFLDDDHKLEKHYESYKIFFDSNHIPTQYVRANTVQNKLPRFQGVNANLILEIMTKIGKQPVILQPPEEIFENDGFLCLSDITYTKQERLFGAIFTYSNQGLETLREDVQIYDDIIFETPSTYTLNIDEENVKLLGNKIQKLIGRNLSLDILLTKRWKDENIEQLVETLAQNKVKTKRVYYISSRTSKFIDDFLLDSNNYRSFFHPYMIIKNNLAFLKMSTETRIYPTLFSVFIELLYPKTAKISQSDLEKILWLTKKRIYRIQEFSLLKELEPIYVFKNLRKMYLGNIQERLTIPLKLLI